jgi:hypothetical protein
MPLPAKLLTLAPVMDTLMEAASEYQACADPDEEMLFDAVDWVRWLDVEVRAAVEWQKRGRVA